MKFIAGPCVIESAELLDTVAERLVEINRSLGVDIIFKASFDKANRTSLESYRGVGMERGLQMLDDVRRKWGLKLLTDIHESYQAAPVGEVVDVIQIPAFLCRQTDLLTAAARTRSPSTNWRRSSTNTCAEPAEGTQMPCCRTDATTRHPSGRYAHVLSQLYDDTACKRARQKSQSSSSVSTALPMTYELPEPEKKPVPPAESASSMPPEKPAAMPHPAEDHLEERKKTDIPKAKK